MLSLFEKSQVPQDVIFVFHTFNIDVAEFIRNSVPFRYPDRNIVFACHIHNPQKRRRMFQEINVVMAPFRPRVIIIDGGMRRASDLIGSGKVINISQRPGDTAVIQRLRNMADLYPAEYDVVAEGFDQVNIVRVEND